MGRTFWLASFLLPKTTAEKATDLYAFCRISDDLADDYQAGNEAKLESLKLFFNRESDSLTSFGRLAASPIQTSSLEYLARWKRVSH